VLIGGLVRVVRPRIARVLAKRRRGARHDVDDLVQQTMAALFAERGRALRAWQPERGLGFLGFVGLLAEREVGMTLRTRKRNPWTEEPTPADSLSSLGGATAHLARCIEARDELRRVLACLGDRLSAPGRRYLQWLVVEQRSVQTVARETGASPDALYAWRTRLFRLVREIRQELGAPPERAESARRRARLAA
ncbi:MAG: sigma-70 family RNA polymerase sigma factor, partial [Kofleriaceae bacterium]